MIRGTRTDVCGTDRDAEAGGGGWILGKPYQSTGSKSDPVGIVPPFAAAGIDKDLAKRA